MKTGLAGKFRSIVGGLGAFVGREYSIRLPVRKLSVENPVKRPVDTFAKPEQFRLLVCMEHDFLKNVSLKFHDIRKTVFVTCRHKKLQ